jgi:WD40 repeat protein/tRNA A-37 threonylcarbamoyl transferase component Bud32
VRRNSGDDDVATLPFDPDRGEEDPAETPTSAATLDARLTRPTVMSDETVVTDEQEGRYDRVAGVELGRGGIGRVIAATDTHIGRQVAIKELLARDEAGEVEARFLREARVTGQLEHPSIVPLHELGRRGDGTLYYTMKVVRGRSLAEAIDAGRDPDERLLLVRHFRDACEAMAYAHSRGVVHRDLKPDNVMVGEFGETVVVDWGLAKVRGTDDIRSQDIQRQVSLLRAGQSAHTVHGHALGTPAYMSPEQARGDLEAIDERSDVWGLGAILYEILTGRPPFWGEDVMATLEAVVSGRPKPVRELCPGAPPELAAVAERALSAEPEDRYSTAAELAADIESWEEGRRVKAYEYSSWELLVRFVRRNMALSIAAVVLLVGSLVSTAVIYRSLVHEEQARLLADRARAEAVEKEIEVEVNHASTLLASALRALEDGDSAGAAVLAASALAHDPGNPHSPVFRGTQDGAARQRTVRAWSTYLNAEGARLHVFERSIALPDAPAIRTPALSPDGRWLAAMVEGKLAVFDLDGDAGPRFHEAEVKDVAAWKPDGSAVALVRGPGSGLYDPTTGERLSTLPGTTRSVAFHETRVFAGQDSGEVLVFEEGSAEAVLTVATDLPRVTIIDVTGDGRMLVMAAKYTPGLVLHDMETGTSARDMAMSAPVWDASFSPDGRKLAVAGEEPRIWIVPLDPALELHSIPASGWVFGVRWSGQERIVSAEAQDGLFVRESGTGRVLERLHRPHNASAWMSIAQNGRIVTARGSAGTADIWKRSPPDLMSSLSLPGNVRHMQTGGGHVLLATPGALWLVEDDSAPLGETGIERIPLPDGYTSAAGIALDPGTGAIAVVTHYGRVAVWRDGRFEELVERWMEHSQALQAVAFSADGKTLFAGGPEGGVTRVALETGEMLAPLEGHGAMVMGMDLSPDGSLLATAAEDASVRIWDVSTGEELHVLEGHEQLASDVAFSPDGKRLLSVDGAGWLRIWDAGAGKPITSWQGSEAWINRCDWSPDGEHIVAASDDDAVRLWTVNGTLVRILPVDGLAIAAAFSSNGHHLYMHLYEQSRRLLQVRVEHGIQESDPVALLQRSEKLGAITLSAGAFTPLETAPGR